jgi:hypothetical protein
MAGFQRSEVKSARRHTAWRLFGHVVNVARQYGTRGARIGKFRDPTRLRPSQFVDGHGDCVFLIFVP